MESQEVEERLIRQDADAKRLKAKAFETRVDKLNYSIKHAKSESELKRFLALKDSSIGTVRKYKQTIRLP